MTITSSEAMEFLASVLQEGQKVRLESLPGGTKRHYYIWVGNNCYAGNSLVEALELAATTGG